MEYGYFYAKNDVIKKFKKFCKDNNLSHTAALTAGMMAIGQCDREALDNIKGVFPSRGDAGKERFKQMLKDGHLLFSNLEKDILSLTIYCSRNGINLTKAKFNVAVGSGEKKKINVKAGRVNDKDQTHEFISREKATPKQWLRALENCDKKGSIVFNGDTYILKRDLQVSPSNV